MTAAAAAVEQLRISGPGWAFLALAGAGLAVSVGIAACAALAAVERWQEAEGGPGADDADVWGFVGRRYGRQEVIDAASRPAGPDATILQFRGPTGHTEAPEAPQDPTGIDAAERYEGVEQ